MISANTGIQYTAVPTAASRRPIGHGYHPIHLEHTRNECLGHCRDLCHGHCADLLRDAETKITIYILYGANKVTSEQRADEIIEKYGMPRNQEMLHAMLAFAHQQGKCDGGEELRTAVRNAFPQAPITV